MSSDPMQTKAEIDTIIKALQEQGINHDSKEEQVTGLGDVVESTLDKFGITEDRFKEWFGLKECDCSKRKKWLNNLFSWKKDK